MIFVSSIYGKLSDILSKDNYLVSLSLRVSYSGEELEDFSTTEIREVIGEMTSIELLSLMQDPSPVVARINTNQEITMDVISMDVRRAVDLPFQIETKRKTKLRRFFRR